MQLTGILLISQFKLLLLVRNYPILQEQIERVFVYREEKGAG